MADPQVAQTVALTTELANRIDRLSLAQALLDFEVANARVLDLTARLVEAQKRVVGLQAENDALRAELAGAIAARAPATPEPTAVPAVPRWAASVGGRARAGWAGLEGLRRSSGRLWNRRPWNRRPWNRRPWNRRPWNRRPWNRR